MMTAKTPKEKAEELIQKFKKVGTASFESDGSVSKSPISDHEAKQCALICVEEIIKSIHDDQPDDPVWQQEREQFWQEVKSELEKIY